MQTSLLLPQKHWQETALFFSKAISENENGVWVLSLILDGCEHTSSIDTCKTKVLDFYYLQRNVYALSIQGCLYGSFMVLPPHCPVTKLCLTLCNPMDCSTPGFPVLYYLLELAQTHVHWGGDAIQPSQPLLPTCPAFNFSQHQGFSQWVGSSH